MKEKQNEFVNKKVLLDSPPAKGKNKTSFREDKKVRSADINKKTKKTDRMGSQKVKISSGR